MKPLASQIKGKTLQKLITSKEKIQKAQSEVEVGNQIAAKYSVSKKEQKKVWN